MTNNAQTEPDEWTFEVQRMVAQTAQITVLAHTEAEARVAFEALKASPDTMWRDSEAAVFYREPTVIAPVPSDDEGWFDVDAYQTLRDYEDGNSETIDGFIREEDAITAANSAAYADYYQVNVVAYGEHIKYERGEGIYQRFKRD